MTPTERADTITAAIETADVPERVVSLTRADDFATTLANAKTAVWGWQVHGAGTVAVKVMIAGGVVQAWVLKDATEPSTTFAARAYARMLLTAADIVDALENNG